MLKGLLAAVLGFSLALGGLAVAAPQDAQAAQCYYQTKVNYRIVVDNESSSPFKITYKIVKYQPQTEVKTPAVPDNQQQPSTGGQKDTNTGENTQADITSTLSQYEQKVVELVNAERAKQGLKPLQVDPALAKVARMKSEDMRDNNYFSHQSPTYGSPFEMMKKFGISYKAAGENIAAGQKTPEAVVEAWMNSPGHRANILNPNYTHIGVGYAAGGSYGTYWTQMFIGK